MHVKRGRQTLQLNGFLVKKNFKQHYFDTGSENQKIWPDHFFSFCMPM